VITTRISTTSAMPPNRPLVAARLANLSLGDAHRPDKVGQICLSYRTRHPVRCSADLERVGAQRPQRQVRPRASFGRVLAKLSMSGFITFTHFLRSWLASNV